MNAISLSSNAVGRDIEYAKIAGSEYAKKWMSGGRSALSEKNILAVAPFELPIHGLDRKDRALVHAFCESAMEAFGKTFNLDVYAPKAPPRTGYRERQAQLDAEHLEAVRVQNVLCDRLDPEKRREKRNLQSQAQARAQRALMDSKNFTGRLFDFV